MNGWVFGDLNAPWDPLWDPNAKINSRVEGLNYCRYVGEVNGLFRIYELEIYEWVTYFWSRDLIYFDDSKMKKGINNFENNDK